MSRSWSSIDELCRLIVKLAYVNVLWFLFCLFGGIVFGWAPATVSFFTLARKWIKREDVPIFFTFLTTYKKEFMKANVSGLVLVLIAGILAMNILILLYQPKTYISIIFMLGNGTLITLFMLFVLFFFPVYVYYEGGLKTIFNKAFLITLVRLPYGILAFVLCFIWVKLLQLFPGLFLFFSISIPVLMVSIISYLGIDIRKESQKLMKKGREGNE